MRATAPMNPQSPPLLQVRDLQVRFGAKQVVHGVSFDIAPGEKLALVGESGSGKTVTALALLRLAGDAQLTGSALMAGRDLLQLSERELRGVRGGDIAMVFQEPMTALNPLMPVGEQVAEVLMLKQALTKAQSAQSAIELLASTGIPEPARRAGSFPHQLSGGQRQRAMIAMALACGPSCCWPTSRRRRSTSRCAARSSICCPTCSARPAWPCCSSRTTCCWCAALPTAWR